MEKKVDSNLNYFLFEKSEEFILGVISLEENAFYRILTFDKGYWNLQESGLLYYPGDFHRIWTDPERFILDDKKKKFHDIFNKIINIGNSSFYKNRKIISPTVASKYM